MRVVMTGATSGIGLVAARALLADGADLTVGARDTAAAAALLPGAQIAHLDLADLHSVREFALTAGTGALIDALVLNAGLQTTRPQLSAQGYELTFAVNHLAHFQLLRALEPAMARNGRIVLTASGVHDPDEKTGMPPPRHADIGRLAHPDTDPARDRSPGTAGRRAYASSKLLNLMTARELGRRLADTRPDLSVAAFDPGFVPATALSRDYPRALVWVSRTVVPALIRLTRADRISTPEISGKLLAELATSPAYAGARGDYYSVRGPRLQQVEPSMLARDEAAAARLWDDSTAMADADSRPQLEEATAKRIRVS